MSQNMGLLTAVHIGNAIDHNGQPSTNGNTDLQYDAQYLNTLGVADRIPEWRQVCGELS
jgi:hypothetical protein